MKQIFMIRTALKFTCKLSLLLIVISCQNNLTKKEPLDKFSIPKLIDDIPLSNKLKISNSISISNYPLIGIYPFSRETKIIDKEWDTTIKEIEPFSFSGLSFYIDTTQKLTIQNDSSNSKYIQNFQREHLAFPCYVINETKILKWLTAQDGELVATLEALDSNSIWKPIEVWLWPTCGLSRHKTPIKPNYYALFKIPIFKGSFETKLRLKIYINNEIYYSPIYKNYINYSQFDKPKELTDKNGNFKISFNFIE